MLRGDIMAIHLDGITKWKVGRGGFLAMSDGVAKETSTQSFSKGLHSGEGYFVQKFTGTGTLFVTSLGAIIQRHLKQGEQLIVDNGHLVAWTCSYTIERAGGSISTSIHSGEGHVCRFTGPGIIYIQVINYFMLVFCLKIFVSDSQSRSFIRMDCQPDTNHSNYSINLFIDINILYLILIQNFFLTIKHMIYKLTISYIYFLFKSKNKNIKN
jgi:hypothetical protein